MAAVQELESPEGLVEISSTGESRHMLADCSRSTCINNMRRRSKLMGEPEVTEVSEVLRAGPFHGLSIESLLSCASIFNL